MEKILEILREINPDIDYENEEKLVDDGILNSLEIMNLIAEIDEVFGVEIDVDEVIAENFNSVNGIMNIIDKHRF